MKGMTAFYLLLTLVGGIAIIVSIINIQWVHGDEWRSRGIKREAGLRTDPARRGNIYSSDGKILATTVTECDLYLDLDKSLEYNDHGDVVYDKEHNPKQKCPIVDSNFNKYIDTVCLMLSEVIPSHNAQYYRDRIKTERLKAKPRRCFLVERRIPYSTWQSISCLPGWKAGVVKQVDGRSVIRQVRAHIYGNMAGNTIGFDNALNQGTYTGLEGAYDSILRGQDGIFNCRRLTKGIWLPDEPRERREVPQRTDNDQVDTIVVQNKVDGLSIISTIDTRYQDIAENSLKKALRQYGGTSGCAVLMEMETGYVLACANLAIDTMLHDYVEMRDRNVAVSDVYEPGSTFKTIILTAMLNDPAIRIDTAMKVKAYYKDFGGKYGVIKDSHHKKDSLSVKEVMEESSNVGMCDLGWMYYNSRRTKLVDLVKGLFPYDKLHLDVKAPEYSTRVNDVNTSNRDFLNFCYGYSTTVSAMRLITFYNALGAGGRMVKPLFCKAIVDNDKIREIKPVVLNTQVCSKESAALMKTILEGVVENGTGNNIKNNTYGIAGKTGTAVHSYANKSRYNGSFAGFFPAENPRYTCLVVIENSPAYGRQAALVFKAISDCVVAVDKRLSNGAVKSAWPTLQADSTKALQVPFLEKGNQEEIMRAYQLLGQTYRSAAPGSKWVNYREGNDTLAGSYVAYTPTAGRVPNCYGMSAKDAVALLREMGYRAKVVGYGKVVSQQPKAGTTMKRGTKVVLELRVKN